MRSHIFQALSRHPALSRPRRRCVRKQLAVSARRAVKVQPRPARAPYVLKFGSRRIPRQMMPEAIVPYLRMSGRWLAEHGFAIGSQVQVLVEYGRVTLISAAAEASRPVAVGE